MTDKQIIIDGVDVSKCEYLQYKGCNFPQCLVKIASFDLKCEGYNCHFKQLKRKEQECEELHSRTASIIYSLTGGRLSYSTYTLEGCEQAYHDQLEIDVERATKELQEGLQAKEQECKNLEEEIRGYRIGIKNISIENTEICKISEKYKQALDKIEQEVKWVLDNKKSEWYTAIVKNVKYKQILDEIKEDISEYIKTPDFFEELDSNSAITRDEYIAICTRHNLASEINNIVKKCDKKE